MMLVIMAVERALLWWLIDIHYEHFMGVDGFVAVELIHRAVRDELVNQASWI